MKKENKFYLGLKTVMLLTLFGSLCTSCTGNKHLRNNASLSFTKTTYDFGELKLNKATSTEIFKNLFPKRKIKEVTQIEFEYSPKRKSEKYTNDSSAFDVFVVYENSDKKKGFFGIEVKYSEGKTKKVLVTTTYIVFTYQEMGYYGWVLHRV